MRASDHASLGRRSAAVCALVAAIFGATAAAAAAARPAQLETVPGFALSGAIGGPVTAVASTDQAAWAGEGVALVEWVYNDRMYADRGRVVPLDARATVRDVALVGQTVWAGTDEGLYGYDTSAGALAAHLATPGAVVGVAGTGDWVVLADETYGYLWADVGEAPRVMLGMPIDGGATGEPAVRPGLVALPGQLLTLVWLQPRLPGIVSQTSLGGEVVGVAFADQILYASVAGVGLVVVDTADPRQPEVLGGLPGIPAGDLMVSGSGLWVVGTDVRLIDILEPRAPLDVFGGPGPYARLSGAAALAAAGGRLVSALGSGLDFTDVRDPLSPEPVFSYDAIWPVASVAVGDGYALLGKGTSGMDLVRLDNPPRWVAGYGPPGGVLGSAADGNIAVLSTGLGGQAVEIGGTDDLTLGTLFGPDWPVSAWIALASDLVVQASIARLDVATRTGDLFTDAGELDYLDDPEWPPNALVQDVSLAPTVAYLAAGPAGIAVIDVSSPARPRYVRSVAVDGSVSSVAVSGNRLAAGTDDGWAILDIDDVRRPQMGERTKSGAASYDVLLNGDRLVVADEVGVRERVLGAPPESERLLGAGPARAAAEDGDSLVALTDRAVIELVRADVQPPGAPTPTTVPTLGPWARPTPPVTREPTSPPPQFAIFLPRAGA